ncbi:HEAT repeat domain-containing protein [Pontiella agarivorans]|uniref:HEAT repeat domain-containing protein n=1 Tax=Pontiella agarivorans TaxID=3038953 RepID=A0ABU5MYF8_9BACT|nr:HEAT repeat domain-containing protein [Pontiella agarivorans]MDZ8119217.1 HEAT repeat domain-containing protein [Pontiella agarivorans]
MKKTPKLETAIWIMFITVIVLYTIGARMIFTGVQRYANEAQAIYGGDHVGALIALVEDENASFEKRNSAIWALGQIGSERALPALHKQDTDELQEPPYDSTATIIQYGVEKSIRQINRFSVTRWMYRLL